MWSGTSQHVLSLVAEFNVLWGDARSVTLTSKWLGDYQRRKDFVVDRRVDTFDGHVADEEAEQPIGPWGIQNEALVALVAT